ncbi:MAG TPA: hypothetical protein VKU44_05850 [Terriglobia bacterium]|nr:hypothetical protein [Terriglobia bacterium]
MEVVEASDGALAVRARCCDDESTESVLTVYQLARTNEEIDAEVAEHLARVAGQHADRERAKAHIARLMA